ncbi:ABC transporter ATP-binding protein [Patescibacteria group bacterium]|nr:ABC transporter ATP-binding protein [Patescibacteria group bacterium]
MAEVAIKIVNVNKRFTNVHAVRDLTLSVKTGEIFALIGPNGAGKTTTVKMITGLIAPTSGRIWVLGKDVAADPVQAKKELGYIPDDPFVYDYLTGREFLQLTGDLFGLRRQETNTRIKKLLKLFNLESVIDGRFTDYSRGNKQKTIIIANVLHQPKVLVIDEPVLGLDVQSQKVTKKLFRDFAKDGGSILLCTHTLSVAQEIADRIGIIKEGELVEEGSLRDLRTKAHKTEASLEELYLKATGEKP